MKITAKGARRIKSKFGAALELMSEIDAVFYVGKTRNIQTLSECSLVMDPPNVTQDLQRFSLANAALEMVDKITIEGVEYRSFDNKSNLNRHMKSAVHARGGHPVCEVCPVESPKESPEESKISLSKLSLCNSFIIFL